MIENRITQDPAATNGRLPSPLTPGYPARILPPLPSAPPGGAFERAGEQGYPVSMSEPDDRPEQGRLYDRCFGKDDGERVIPWRYDRSPHGSVVAPIARDESGTMVSSYACSPRRVHYRGRRMGGGVGQTGDVMTLPKLRSKGVFSDLHWTAMERAREREIPAAWGLPNESSGHIFFGKLGWKLAGHIGPWNCVLRFGARARAARLVNGRLAAWGVPWSAWRGRVARRKLARQSEGLYTAPIARFEPGVEKISAAVEKHFDWMVHRDAEYLNWRFVDAPSGLFRPIGVYGEEGELRGYAVVQRPRAGEAVGFVVDLLGLDGAACSAAMDAALAWLAAEGAAVARAYAMKGSWWERELARSGFRPPRGYKEVGAYAIEPGHPLADSTLDTSSWYFMDGDRDDETAR